MCENGARAGRRWASELLWGPWREGRERLARDQTPTDGTQEEAIVVRKPLTPINGISRRSLVVGLGALVLVGGLVVGAAAADPTPAAGSRSLVAGLAARLGGPAGEPAAAVGSEPRRDAVEGAAGYEIQAAADYLGVSVDGLRVELGSGKSLGDIARAREGRNVEGLRAVLIACGKPRIDEIVSQGRLPTEQRLEFEQQLAEHVERLVESRVEPKR